MWKIPGLWEETQTQPQQVNMFTRRQAGSYLGG